MRLSLADITLSGVDGVDQRFKKEGGAIGFMALSNAL